jgi:preprotein translocase subunit SecD
MDSNRQATHNPEYQNQQELNEQPMTIKHMVFTSNFRKLNRIQSIRASIMVTRSEPSKPPKSNITSTDLALDLTNS